MQFLHSPSNPNFEENCEEKVDSKHLQIRAWNEALRPGECVAPIENPTQEKRYPMKEEKENWKNLEEPMKKEQSQKWHLQVPEPKGEKVKYAK